MGDEIANDATIEGDTRSNRGQNKLIEEVKRGKDMPINVDIVDISNENETTPLSQLYLQNAIKKEHGNTNIGTK